MAKISFKNNNSFHFYSYIKEIIPHCCQTMYEKYAGTELLQPEKF